MANLRKFDNDKRTKSDDKRLMKNNDKSTKSKRALKNPSKLIKADTTSRRGELSQLINM